MIGLAKTGGDVNGPARTRDGVATGFRWPLLVGLLAMLGMWVAPASAPAASCGGGRQCACGDTVSADYVLARDLGPCSGHGLSVKSRVTLDCAGARITGLGNGSEQWGIILDGKVGAEVSGATVKNCKVSGFFRGIRLRSASGNVISANTTTGNGNQSTHEGYGIDVSGASTDNLIEKNQVHGNADEGIHVGRGSNKNRLVANVSSDNYRENLYVLAAHSGVFQRNTLGGGGINSLYLKDSSFNRFEGNTFVGKTARIIGNARDNVFVGNTFSSAGVHFTEYKEKPPRHPTGNRVTGGEISNANECIRFTNSTDNVVADVSLAECRTTVRAESHGGPTTNTVVGDITGKMEIDDDSTLDLGFDVKVEVREPSGVPVPGAQVEARDPSGGTAFSAATDDAGKIPTQIAIGASRTGGKTTPRPPLTLAVSKPGYVTDTRRLPTAGPVNLSISLKPDH